MCDICEMSEAERSEVDAALEFWEENKNRCPCGRVFSNPSGRPGHMASCNADLDGWTMASIAERFGIQRSTLRTYYYEHKEERKLSVPPSRRRYKRKKPVELKPGDTPREWLGPHKMTAERASEIRAALDRARRSGGGETLAETNT